MSCLGQLLFSGELFSLRNDRRYSSKKSWKTTLRLKFACPSKDSICSLPLGSARSCSCRPGARLLVPRSQPMAGPVHPPKMQPSARRPPTKLKTTELWCQKRRDHRSPFYVSFCRQRRVPTQSGDHLHAEMQRNFRERGPGTG